MPDAPLLQVKALLQSIQDKKEEQRRLQKLWEDGQTEIQVVAAYSAVCTWQQPGLLHICMRAQRWCHVKAALRTSGLPGMRPYNSTCPACLTILHADLARAIIFARRGPKPGVRGSSAWWAPLRRMPTSM